MATTHAVILARGLGTRMRREDPSAALTAEQAAAAGSGVTALIDVGRPFLDYVISALADAGVTDVCLIIGPEHDALREYVRATSGGRSLVCATDLGLTIRATATGPAAPAEPAAPTEPSEPTAPTEPADPGA
ncbi:hypothetical protein [Helcobacillus massiliensis]|uniref:Bifunctional N-acetylglucosamine-1-phosphate-uridyltransferase/glucosamine-1-phosphate-acetyltransferase GlmU-like protein n=1 Tax=Helcobacillus massiliensis TaxID=521392 RepID=A0A839QV59_9MICO|nr:hypothetical protein [Helcobacillus massiliensis]MBB3023615.1 bifunctional N-acetylglucosamine-1-phosphate-uridyltransferase/glucosamine-1-phosphate-acetyltransferase GlmU-like protein [Helcobacillus massiliensis]